MLIGVNTQGSKVKLPLARKGREGKVLGKAARQGHDDAGSDEEGGGEGGDDLVLRAADAAESHGFRALFSVEEDGRLGAAAPFAGQVHVGGIRHSGSCGIASPLANVCAAACGGDVAEAHVAAVRIVWKLFCRVMKIRQRFFSPAAYYIVTARLDLTRKLSAACLRRPLSCR